MVYACLIVSFGQIPGSGMTGSVTSHFISDSYCTLAFFQICHRHFTGPCCSFYSFSVSRGGNTHFRSWVLSTLEDTTMPGQSCWWQKYWRHRKHREEENTMNFLPLVLTSSSHELEIEETMQRRKIKFYYRYGGV